MSNQPTLLNEGQSAERARISVETLRQYVNIGLLEPRISGKEDLYSEEDIDRLFVNPFPSRSRLVPRSELEREGRQETSQSSEKAAPAAEPRKNPEHAQTQPNSVSEELAKVEEALKSATAFEAKKEEPPKKEKSPAGDKTEAQQEPKANSQQADNVATEREFIHVEQIELEEGEPFEKRLPVTTNYDHILVNRRLRDEIRMLREERDWLRQRLEKLEARSERDQMLMLSESETIRSLVNKAPKRGLLALALPWLWPSTK